jgi:phage baseplate assembly protein W
MANNRKYLGIRFPFTAKDSEAFYVDMDYNPYLEIKSDLTHLLFTSKGQRLRNPSFGSRLLEYIFEPNDNKTYTDIKIEMQEVMKKYFPGITLLELNVTKGDSTLYGANINLKYEIDEGSYKTFDSINITI